MFDEIFETGIFETTDKFGRFDIFGIFVSIWLNKLLGILLDKFAKLFTGIFEIFAKLGLLDIFWDGLVKVFILGILEMLLLFIIAGIGCWGVDWDGGIGRLMWLFE